MTEYNGTNRYAILLAAVVAFACYAAQPGAADAQATVILTDGTRYENVGIRYSRRDEKYMITRTGRSEASFPLDPDRIQRLILPPPGGLEEALKRVASGERGEAFRFLETVVRDFAMLNWDITAAAGLTAAHVADNSIREAIEVGRGIERNYAGRALPMEFYDSYWSALASEGRLPDLERSISAAVAAGTPRTAALAAMKRGDIYKAREDWKEALISGFLRVIAMHTDQRDMLPEALFKAAACFTAMGRHQHADQMRSRLRAGFPQSRFAQQLSGGS